MILNFFLFVESLMARFGFFSRLLTRITLGAVFIHSGYGKLQHIGKVIEYFSSLGIPAPQIQAPCVAALESSCGLFVLLGFITCWACIPLSAIMAVAILTAKRPELTSIYDLVDVSEFLYLILLLWLITEGGGRFSVDGLIRREKKSP